VSPLADLLPVVGEALGLHQKVADMAVCRLWSQAVSPAIAQVSEAASITRQAGQVTLHVRAVDGPTATWVQMNHPQLIATLNGFHPQTGVKIDRIQVTVGRHRVNPS
jgi:hypothetical protein